MKKIKQKMKLIVPVVMFLSLLLIGTATTNLSLADDADPSYPEKLSNPIDLSDEADPPFPESVINNNFAIISGVT